MAARHRVAPASSVRFRGAARLRVATANQEREPFAPRVRVQPRKQPKAIKTQASKRGFQGDTFLALKSNCISPHAVEESEIA